MNFLNGFLHEHHENTATKIKCMKYFQEARQPPMSLQSIPSNRAEESVLLDLDRVLPHVTYDLLWSREFWTYLGGAARLSYLRYGELLQAILKVSEDIVFAFREPIRDYTPNFDLVSADKCV